MTENITLRLYDRVWLFRISLLAFLWVLGLVIGIHLSINVCAADYLLLDTAISMTPSLTGAFVAAFISIVLCLIGIYTDCFFINCIAILTEAVCRGFCGFLIYLFFGSGAWLLRFVFMFSSAVRSVLVWWMLFGYCSYGRPRLFKTTGIVVVVMIVFVVVDLFFISPLLIHLSMYF